MTKLYFRLDGCHREVEDPTISATTYPAASRFICSLTELGE